MIRHSRDDWTSTPAADAHPLSPGLIRGVVVHYVGPKVPAAVLAGEPAAVARYLRGIYRYHTAVKGWSDFAYNIAVDTRGNGWDGRGLRHQSAANGDQFLNARWIAVLAIIGKGQEPTEAMLDGIRHTVALTRQLYPQGRAIRGHSEVRPDPTACPGPFLMRAVNSNRLQPTRKPRPEDIVDKKDIKQIADAVADEIMERLTKKLKKQPEKVAEELSRRLDGNK